MADNVNANVNVNSSSRAASSSSSNARQPRQRRSRIDRPCDLCRRHKHMCVIEVRSDPCVTCKARNKPCTFNAPPVSRHRRDRDRGALTKNGGADENGFADSSGHGDEDAVQNPPFSLNHPPNPPAGMGHSPTIHVHNVQTSSRSTSPHHSVDITNIHFEDMDDSEYLVNHGSPSSDGTADVPIVHPPSLDLEDGNVEESHFLGPSAFAAFMIRNAEAPETSADQGALAFRQVSSDPGRPVFFVKNPALMYGRTAKDSKSAFAAIQKICAPHCQDAPSKAVIKVLQTTLPAMPIINSKRLESSCLGVEGSSPAPYGLLSGIIAHSGQYLSELRPLFRELWHHALQALDDEYRQPRLSTLQLALMTLCSRPQFRGENAGQSTIGLARALGAAHVLGLHLDPTDWALPQWERNLRKRLWWALVIQDKWRALLFGRPSHLPKSSYRVPVPTVDEGDWGKYGLAIHRISMETFVATCHLTVIVDEVLESFFSVDAFYDPETPIVRMARLEQLLARTDAVNRSLSHTVRWHDIAPMQADIVPTGVYSFQLSYLGLSVILHRLLLDCLDDDTSVATSRALSLAFKSCERVQDLLIRLTNNDQNMYWAGYSSHHISNTVNLLLRTAVRSRLADAELFGRVISSTVNFVSILCRLHREDEWDVVSCALRPIASVLLVALHDVPEALEAYDKVASELRLPTRGPTSSQDDLFQLGYIDPGQLLPLSSDYEWMTQFGLWDTA